MTKVNCIKPFSKVCAVLVNEGMLVSGNTKSDYRIVKIMLNMLICGVAVILPTVDIIKSIRTGDGRRFIKATCVFMPIANFISKMFIILKKPEHLVKIFEFLKSEVFNNHNKDLNAYVKIVYKISTMMWKYFILLGGTYLVMVVGMPLITSAPLMIPAPFEMGEYLVYYKVLLAGTFSYTALNSICIDIMFLNFLALCIAQSYILEQRLMYVFEEATEICGNEHPSDICLYEEKVLGICVTLHNSLFEYVTILSSILSLPLLLQYGFGCFIMCNLILQITVMGQRDKDDLLATFAYAGMTFTQMATYHWLGNEIMFKSVDIINACYLSKWYKLSRKSKKSLLILMERAKRPFTIQIYNIIVVSLESLGVVVQWAYSLFALIQARYG